MGDVSAPVLTEGLSLPGVNDCLVTAWEVVVEVSALHGDIALPRSDQIERCFVRDQAPNRRVRF